MPGKGWGGQGEKRMRKKKVGVFIWGHCRHLSEFTRNISERCTRPPHLRSMLSLGGGVTVQNWHSECSIWMQQETILLRAIALEGLGHS